jgi:hypothetical protein
MSDMKDKRTRTPEARPLGAAEEAEVLRRHGVERVEELPADVEVVVGDWEDVLADVDRREAEIREQSER